MKTCGEFHQHKYTIDVTKGPASLVFFGDVHRDSPNFAKGAWRSFMDHCKTLNNPYYVGMGDYIDSMSTSERAAIVRAELHETTKTDLDHLANSKVDLLAKELAFMKGRLVGLISGNHYYTYPSGITCDHKLCEKLSTKFLGVSAFIYLTVKSTEGQIPLILWVHHGAGGSRLIGGSINRVAQMAEHADADIFVMGHDHKRGVMPGTPRLVLKNHNGELSLTHKEQWFGRSGSFLASYEDGVSSYNVDAARGPCSLGHIEFEVSFVRKQHKKKRTSSLKIRGIA